MRPAYPAELCWMVILGLAGSPEIVRTLSPRRGCHGYDLSFRLAGISFIFPFLFAGPVTARWMACRARSRAGFDTRGAHRIALGRAADDLILTATAALTERLFGR